METKEDPDTLSSLERMSDVEKVSANQLESVKLVLIVLSSRGMAFDLEALRQMVVSTYPDAAVFFETPLGKTIGPHCPDHVDLLIDFTGPRERQRFCSARRYRRLAKLAVGRNASYYRRNKYDRVFDEFSKRGSTPVDLLDRERFVQKNLLKLAGIPVVQKNETPPDRGKIVPLELAGFARAEG